jgi:hypothetical protein
MKKVLLLVVSGALFWGTAFALNTGVEINMLKAVLALIVGVVLAIATEKLENKNSALTGAATFAAFLIVYKFISGNDILLMGLFVISFLAPITLSLMDEEGVADNKLAAVAVVLPLYVSLAWLKELNYGVAVGVLALLSSFALNFDFKVNDITRRAGVFAVVALLTYLVLNNFFTLPLPVIGFVIGGFFAYLLSLPKETYFDLISGFVLTLLVGFIATRLFGTWGLLLLSLCCIGALPYKSEYFVSFPSLAALFFTIKAASQVFIQTNTLNVTGLNLNHPYVYAGLVLGMALPALILAVATTYGKDVKGFNPYTLVLSALIIPLTIVYLLHAEATAAFLVALSVSAFIFAAAAPAIIKTYSNAMLPLAGLVSIVLLTSQRLVDIGNLATRLQRIEVIAITTLVIVLVSAVLFRFKRPPEIG